MGWAPVPDLGWGRRPKLHGMQAVAVVIGLAVPGRPIRSLVVEDRSADGVRDRTGPEPRRSAMGPQPAGKRRTTAGMNGHRTFGATAGRST
jgi:hypothetical protein